MQHIENPQDVNRDCTLAILLSVMADDEGLSAEQRIWIAKEAIKLDEPEPSKVAVLIAVSKRLSDTTDLLTADATQDEMYQDALRIFHKGMSACHRLAGRLQ